MLPYTTEWAKEVLRLFPEYKAIFQMSCAKIIGGAVFLVKDIPKLKWTEHNYNQYWDGVWSDFKQRFNCHELPRMLEHPDGWQNSKVTRDQL